MRVRGDNLVPLACRADTLRSLAAGLKRFGAAGGEPEWLVSAVWLCTAHSTFFATASPEILADGYLARRLAIATPADVAAGIDCNLPNIEGRLLSRGSGIDLPQSAVLEPPAEGLSSWEGSDATTKVVLRVAERDLATDRIAVGLLFGSGAKRLLVATDPSMLAMVLSDDPALIDRYCAGCELLSVAQYLEASES